jgi:hypothetical protein
MMATIVPYHILITAFERVGVGFILLVFRGCAEV